jgi:hypothetical protein
LPLARSSSRHRAENSTACSVDEIARKPKLPTWRITSQEGRHLGTLQAATADEAIKIAIREFSMSESGRRGRVVAQKIGPT